LKEKCKNLLISPPIPTSYDESTFLDSDYTDLLTGELIAEFVEHSINHALKSASSYKLSMEEFQSMYTDIFCGVQCPQKRQHEIYVYRMKSKRNEEGILYAYTDKKYINKDEIAVLGMKKDFEEMAKSIYDEALKQKIKPSEVTYKYLNKCIDIVQSKKGNEVGKIRPVLIYQTNILNECKHPTTIILPISTVLIDDTYPLRYRITKRDNLEKTSDVLCDHSSARKSTKKEQKQYKEYLL
jgi:mRNA-degrading endonuclease toxin of MazEF toxin-antitoxin module